MPRPRLRGGRVGRAGRKRGGRGGGARDHRADALDAAVLLGRRGRRAPARELLLDVSGRVAPWRLDPHHAPRRRGHLGALGRDDQPPGRADGHRGDLPRRDRRERGARRASRRRAGRRAASSDAHVRRAARARSSTTSSRAHQAADPRRLLAAARAKRGDRDRRGPADAVGQGARGAGEAHPDGRGPEQAASVDSLANPASLQPFVALAATRATR